MRRAELTPRLHIGRFDAWVEFVPADLWLGLFVGKSTYEMGRTHRDFYLCLLPMLPIHIVYASAFRVPS